MCVRVLAFCYCYWSNGPKPAAYLGACNDVVNLRPRERLLRVWVNFRTSIYIIYYIYYVRIMRTFHLCVHRKNVYSNNYSFFFGIRKTRTTYYYIMYCRYRASIKIHYGDYFYLVDCNYLQTILYIIPNLLLLPLAYDLEIVFIHRHWHGWTFDWLIFTT